MSALPRTGRGFFFHFEKENRPDVSASENKNNNWSIDPIALLQQRLLIACKDP